MSTIPTIPSIPQKRQEVPPLRAGDRLTRAEFERRFDATRGLKKAELLEGVVYTPPPVFHQEHSNPHFNLIALFGQYCAATPGVEGGDNGSVRLDLDNMPQPDVSLRICEACGGQSRVDEDGYLSGAPEFVAEVAATSANYDLHAKLRVYCRHGVREYMVWRTFDRAIDYFILVEGRYDRAAPDPSGFYRSQVLPGLWIDAPAILRGDLAAASATLQRGIASPDHTAFVQRLKPKA